MLVGSGRVRMALCGLVGDWSALTERGECDSLGHQRRSPMTLSMPSIPRHRAISGWDPELMGYFGMMGRAGSGSITRTGWPTTGCEAFSRIELARFGWGQQRASAGMMGALGSQMPCRPGSHRGNYIQKCRSDRAERILYVMTE